MVGDVVESAIDDVLSKAGVSYRKTKRAERIAGFDQWPISSSLMNSTQP
jgi:hypothetical protein